MALRGLPEQVTIDGATTILTAAAFYSDHFLASTTGACSAARIEAKNSRTFE
jgi:hypothetical protein